MKLKNIAAGAAIAVAVLGFTASSGSAALIDNGSSTIDTSSGLEWLDVQLTTGQSYTSVLGDFGGYISAGYRYANISDICSLFGALGDSVPSCPAQDGTIESIAPANAATLVDLLGDTFVVNGTGTFFGVVCGRYDDGDAGDGNVGVAAIKTDPFNGQCEQIAAGNTVAARENDASLSDQNSYIGSFLVRNTAVAEPASAGLIALVFAGMMAARRKRMA